MSTVNNVGPQHPKTLAGRSSDNRRVIVPHSPAAGAGRAVPSSSAVAPHRFATRSSQAKVSVPSAESYPHTQMYMQQQQNSTNPDMTAMTSRVSPRRERAVVVHQPQLQQQGAVVATRQTDDATSSSMACEGTNKEGGAGADGQLVPLSAALDRSLAIFAEHDTLVVQSTETPNIDLSSSSREIFRKILEESLAESGTYQSPNLYCEALLRRAYSTEGCDSAVKAAVGCWGLHILSQSVPLLSPIRNTLVPFLFADYRSDNLVQGASPADHINFDVQTLHQQPFLSHEFFAVQHKRIEKSLEEITNAHARQMLLVEHKKSAGMTVIGRWKQNEIRRCFFAWRGYTRTLVIERFAKKIKDKHGHRESRLTTLEATFYRWRHAVELSRGHFLEERANILVHQMDNAKNQFQLQCFRSDKYLRTVEELREDLAEARSNGLDLKKEIKRLEVKLRDHQREAENQLDKHVNEVLQSLGHWRTFARSLVERRAARMRSVEENSKPTGGDSDESSSDDDDFASPTSDKGGGGGAPDDTPPPPLFGTQSVVQPGAFGSLNADQFLLRWCTNVVRTAVVSQVHHVHNFTTDFQSGEVLILLMHHVFPNKVPFSPLQEANLTKRFDAIIELAKLCGMSFLVRASDIREGTGDVMLMTVTELFLRHAAIQRGDVATYAGSDAADEATVHYDAAMLEHVLTEATKEMLKLRQEAEKVESQEAAFGEMEEGLLDHSAYFSRNRFLGHPVEITDSKELSKFIKFNPARFQDIAFKYKNKTGGNSAEGGERLEFEMQLKALKKGLRHYFNDIRKIFKFYSGGGGTMTDVDFWRFCADIRAADKGLSRLAIEKIFLIANSDDIPQAVTGEEEEEGELPELDEDEENPATELIPSEFVECLIRMADAKVPGGKMIQDRFAQFMQNYVLAFACKSDSDRFKKEIYLPSTQTAVQRYQKDFTKIFLHYAGGKGKKKVMQAALFAEFVKDAHITECEDAQSQHAIFLNVLGLGGEELAQHDFLEAIVCMSAYKTPNPFIGLDRKLDILATAVLSTLRPKLRPQGVQLAEYKIVTAASLQQLTK